MTRLSVFLLHLAIVCSALALTDGELQGIRFDQNTGRRISFMTAFRDSTGSPRKIGEIFHEDRPVILVLGYFHCPMLCTLVNDGLIKAMQDLRLDAGRDFTVVDLSIDPGEAPSRAAARKTEYLKQYGRSSAAGGWHFLVGEKPAIDTIAAETGFHYAYDAASGEYAHPSGLVILTPDGTISSYLLGVNFDSAELLNALQIAGRGERGHVAQQLALLCFHYNPITGKYSFAILKALRLAGLLTVVGIAVVIFRLSRRKSLAANA